MKYDLICYSQHSRLISSKIFCSYFIGDDISQYLSIYREKIGLNIEFHHIGILTKITTRSSDPLTHSTDTKQCPFADSITIAIMDKSRLS